MIYYTMFFIFFLNLSLFINLSSGQPDMGAPVGETASGPLNGSIQPKAVVPVGAAPTQITATPSPNKTTSAGCEKWRIPAGCTCELQGSVANINCHCQEVYKKLVYFSNSFIKFNLKRQCLIDFFPGCSPVVLPEGVNQPCEKLKRIVPKLEASVKAQDLAHFCTSSYQQKSDMTVAGQAQITCLGSGEHLQGQVVFLP